MSTISKERVKDILEFGAGRIISPITDDEIMELARIALASLEVEAVAYMYKDNLQSDARFSLHTRFGNWSQEDINEYEITEIPLYTAPPVPVSVPDDRYQNLSELYHAQEKRLFKLAQRIKGSSFDKYAYSPSQAIDVLESAIFGEREDDCRDAMLQGAEQPQNEQQNIPENIPATQFKSVADLYGLTSPTGSETSFTFDAVEARDFIDGGWSCQEYVELERYQNAVAGNSPVIPDDVRRMDWLVSKTVDVREPMVYGSHSLFWSQTITDEEDDYHATKLREQIDAAMAAEQAAAPQQEVNNG